MSQTEKRNDDDILKQPMKIEELFLKGSESEFITKIISNDLDTNPFIISFNQKCFNLLKDI